MSYRHSLSFSLVALAIALASCGGHQNGNGGDSDTGNDATTTFDGAILVNGCPQGNEQIQQYILVPRCGSCHGSSNPQGALDLVSPDVAMRLTNTASATCSGQTLLVPNDANASYLYRKVADATPACGSRMPLSGALPANEIACLQAWIAGGLQPTPADAGVPEVDAGPVWMPTPGSTPECNAIEGINTNAAMCPGSDCLSCHRAGGQADGSDVRWTIAGTVFPTATSDVTAGVSGAIVHITDATGLSFDLTTNAVGNFYTRRAVTFPLMADITHGTTMVSMPIPVPSGSCNNCHTLPSASMTAGRIYLGM